LRGARRRGLARPLARQNDAATGRDDDGLNAIADRHLDVAVVVLELGKIDLRLALSSDADEGHFRTECDDGPLDGLAPLKSTRLDGRLEHRCEVFFLLAHCRSIRSGTPAIIRGGDTVELFAEWTPTPLRVRPPCSAQAREGGARCPEV